MLNHVLISESMYSIHCHYDIKCHARCAIIVFVMRMVNNEYLILKFIFIKSFCNVEHGIIIDCLYLSAYNNTDSKINNKRIKIGYSVTLLEKHMKKIIIVFATLLIMSYSHVFAGELKVEYEKMLVSAISAQKKAAAVGGEWRDVNKLIKKAKKAANKGQYKKAITFAKNAETQGKLGYQQAVSQINVDIPPYIQ